MPEQTPRPQAVDEYLDRLSDEQRATLESLSVMIRGAAPEAIETTSYGLPAFGYLGHPLVAYGATKTHCAFYLMSPAVMESMSTELARWDTSKGAIRFQPTDPLPKELVEALVRARMAESDVRWG